VFTKLETSPGETIFHAAKRAARHAEAGGYDYVEIKFNGIELHVKPKSLPEDIGLIYQLKHELQRAGLLRD